MRLGVRLFAAFRERAGTSLVEVDVPDGASAGAIMDAVVAAAPGLAGAIAAARPVMNQEFVDRETPVRPGDEVALLPPVSGG